MIIIIIIIVVVVVVVVVVQIMVGQTKIENFMDYNLNDIFFTYFK